MDGEDEFLLFCTAAITMVCYFSVHVKAKWRQNGAGDRRQTCTVSRHVESKVSIDDQDVTCIQ